MELTEGVERITGRARLQRSRRLRSSTDIARARRGRRLNGVFVTLNYVRQPEPGPSRVGFVVSKRVGGAVVRNHVKRRLREAVRLKVTLLAPGWDMLWTARPASAQAAFTVLATEIDELLARASLETSQTGQDTL